MVELVGIINHLATVVVAIDMPTGIPLSAPFDGPHSIRATETLAQDYPKLGLFLGRAPSSCGNIKVIFSNLMALESFSGSEV